jgi:hypothetical protein
MALSELVNMLSNIAEVAVSVLVAYVVYKIAKLIETLDGKIKTEARA